MESLHFLFDSWIWSGVTLTPLKCRSTCQCHIEQYQHRVARVVLPLARAKARSPGIAPEPSRTIALSCCLHASRAELRRHLLFRAAAVEHRLRWSHRPRLRAARRRLRRALTHHRLGLLRATPICRGCLREDSR
jgi:hypothetical protein